MRATRLIWSGREVSVVTWTPRIRFSKYARLASADRGDGEACCLRPSLSMNDLLSRDLSENWGIEAGMIDENWSWRLLSYGSKPKKSDAKEKIEIGALPAPGIMVAD